MEKLTQHLGIQHSVSVNHPPLKSLLAYQLSAKTNSKQHLECPSVLTGTRSQCVLLQSYTAGQPLVFRPLSPKMFDICSTECHLWYLPATDAMATNTVAAPGFWLWWMLTSHLLGFHRHSLASESLQCIDWQMPHSWCASASSGGGASGRLGRMFPEVR